ncbi:MAG: selenium metabolism-associated LysR family transcriptional regulator [Thioalkalispiraceae bacterium]|jgi:DNA-binding transcriptional LysR family regulator
MADRRLQVFHTVARLLSFTKAAEELHMTQPAVTFQVRQLEEQFNTRLFDRTHNRISLTDAGNRVYDYAEKIFQLYNEMDHSVRELTGDISGVLILGASTTIAEYMLPVLLGDFKAKHPEVTIRLKVANTDGIVAQVENNEIDLGVVEAPVNNKNLIVEECRTDHLVLIVPPGHELANEEKVSIEKIIQYPFICREEGSGTREVMIESMQTAGINPSDMRIAMELGSLEAIKGAVETGMGVSILSKATLLKELQLGTLVAVDTDPPINRPFSFVHQKQKFKARAMEELLNFARSYCEAHQEI